MQDGAELRTVERIRQHKVREAEIILLAEPDDENAFTLLRHKCLRIDDLPVDLIPEFDKRAVDNLERPALVVIDQILDVLQQKGAGPVMLDNLRNIEEQRALRLVKKAMRPVERVFF